MYTFRTQRLRGKLSAPTSGSARRRARERLRAQQTREEGELLARRRSEQQHLDKIQQQRKDREELASYEPWGRPGGGAPNLHGIRFTDLRALSIYPEDELKGTNQSKGQGFSSARSRRRRRHRTPLRLREDPQTLYTETLRKSVDNDIRYRQTPDQQQTYKEILDDLVEVKRRQMKEKRKRDLEYERKMQTMDGPWGKPGPGGTTWRNPRDVGLNFSNSMGWTDNNLFNKLKIDHRRRKRSSFTLPKVKREDDTVSPPDKENIKPSNDKLPDINGAKNLKNVREANIEDTVKEVDELKPIKNKQKRSPKKNKFVKRLSNGERIKKVLTEDLHNTSFAESNEMREQKLTPEETILRMTGGIELVPLLARRRRIGARTLPSSDVTRPPEQACQWREMDSEYLRELKNQMRVKIEQKQEKQRNSAESVRQHHETWAALWGRPGHGAPQQRGRYARSNLAHLLYLTTET